MMQLLKYFWFKKVSGLFILPINKLWKFEFFVCMHSLAIRTVFEKLPLMMSNIRVGRGVHQNSSKMAKNMGRCWNMDFVRSYFGTNEPMTSLTLFSSLSDWSHSKPVKKRGKKCATDQRFICTEVTSYKIHTLIDIPL